MHLVITVNSLRKGGLEKATLDLARYLQKDGIDITLVLFNNIQEQTTSDFSNIRIANTEDPTKISAVLKDINSHKKIHAALHTRTSIQTPWIERTFYVIHTVVSERLEGKNFFSHKKECIKNKEIT